MRVLVIEDEKELASLIRRALEEAGYKVETSDGRGDLPLLLSKPFGLIILDLMLPGVDGRQICKSLREQGDTTPILMISARSSSEDRVSGLDIGADDYLAKPFKLEELLARVRALLRRHAGSKASVIRVADLEIDTIGRDVRRGGKQILLTLREFRLLEALARRKGQVLTRDIIRDSVWGLDESYSNIVDAFIKTLRKKVDGGHRQKLIHTVYGHGYTLRAPDGECM